MAGYTGKWLITGGEVRPRKCSDRRSRMGRSADDIRRRLRHAQRHRGVTGLRTGAVAAEATRCTATVGITLGPEWRNARRRRCRDHDDDRLESSPAAWAADDSGAPTSALSVLVKENTYTAATSVSAGTLSLQNILRSTSAVTYRQCEARVSRRRRQSFRCTPTITFAGTGKLDLQDNDAIVRNALLTRANVGTLVSSGYGTGTWNGTGITLTTAGASGGTTSVGVIHRRATADTTRSTGRPSTRPTSW